MSHNPLDQFHALVTRLTAADGTVAAERSQELLDTVLAREVLAAIVGGISNGKPMTMKAPGNLKWSCIGRDCPENTNPYAPGGLYREGLA